MCNEHPARKELRKGKPEKNLNNSRWPLLYNRAEKVETYESSFLFDGADGVFFLVLRSRGCEMSISALSVSCGSLETQTPLLFIVSRYYLPTDQQICKRLLSRAVLRMAGGLI